MEVRDGEDDELVMDLIREACLASRYRQEAAAEPGCARGWWKMSLAHSGRVTALADEIGRGAGEIAPRPFTWGQHPR